MRHNLTLVSALIWWFAILDLEGQVTFFEYRDYNTCNIAFNLYNRVLPTYRIVRCQSSTQRKPLEKQHNRYGNLGTDLGTKDAT